MNPPPRAERADWADTFGQLSLPTQADPPDTVPDVPPDGAAWSNTLPQAQRGRALCIGVDDVGLHPGVNGAAIDLVLRGRVQALACRVGAPHWAEAVGQLRRLRGLAVDVGLQLDLSHCTLDAGVRRPLRQWLLGVGRPRRALLQREIRDQFEAFEAALGQAPHFVAGHRHVHQLRGVREAVLAEIEQRYAPGHRPWVRQGRRGGQGPLPQRLRAWAVECGGAHALAQAARELGIHQNRGLLGVYDFKGGTPRFRSLLLRWLALAREGELLVCHPSLASVVPDRWLPARQAEYKLIGGPEWASLVERLDLDLQPMSRILAKRSRW